MSDAKLMENHRFLWGASTSSYQVEGGISNNDWEFFARSDLIKKRILFSKVCWWGLLK
jgi:beta-glucosidase/6-phospho-beta-glucosidase/beta-galactosidase